MRVLQIIKTNIGATWAFEQSKKLCELGVEVITVLPNIDGGMAEKYINNGMKVIKGDFELPIFKPFKILVIIKNIKNITNDVNPDIIHCHFVSNILMLRIALKKTKIPRLFQVPGPLHLENKYFRKLDILLSNSYDYWAGSCKKTVEIYKNEKVPKNNLFLAYYGGYGGISCDKYKDNTNILHKDYNLGADDILVGMVSYFYKPKKYLGQKTGIKGHEDFIDAIKIVRYTNSNVKGIIIGDAWINSHKYMQEVVEYASTTCPNGITFTGFRSDLKDIYRELDIAVHPSYSENLGGAAESLAAGVPTISTNIGGFTDIVINNKTGFVVNPGSPIELAESILFSIDNYNEIKQMALKGQNFVRSLLDIENCGKVIYEILMKIYTNKKGDRNVLS